MGHKLVSSQSAITLRILGYTAKRQAELGTAFGEQNNGHLKKTITSSQEVTVKSLLSAI